MFLHFCPLLVHTMCLCESVCACLSWCVFLQACVYVCVLLNQINSAGSSLLVEKPLPVVTSVLQFHTHTHTVEHHRIQSDGGSDEGVEGRRERMVLRRNDERIALT